MKKFVNNPDDVVDEMLEGYLYVHSRHVRKLDAARTVFGQRENGYSCSGN